MITINNKLVNINDKESFVQYPPPVIQSANLKGWYKLESLNDVVLNFQNQTGTVSTNSGVNTVTGSGTSFSQNDVGKRIRINAEDKWIVSVSSTTSLIVDSNYSNTNASIAYSYGCVSKWKNSAIGMPDFEQSTTTSQPFIALNNNKIVVRFNLTRDTDMLTTLTTYSLGTIQTYFVKLLNNKAINGSDIFNSGIVISTDNERPRITLNNVNGKLGGYNLANDGSNGWLSQGDFANNISGCVINNGNGWTVINQNAMNKTEVGNFGSPSTNRTINARYALGNYASQNSTYSFKGDFYEFVVYNSVLTNSDISKILHYLNSKK